MELGGRDLFAACLGEMLTLAIRLRSGLQVLDITLTRQDAGGCCGCSIDTIKEIWQTWLTGVHVMDNCCLPQL